MFKKLNEKYDNLEEPKRFFIFLALMAPMFISMVIFDLTEIRGFATFGILWIAAVAIPRILASW